MNDTTETNRHEAGTHKPVAFSALRSQESLFISGALGKLNELVDVEEEIRGESAVFLSNLDAFTLQFVEEAQFKV